MFSAWKKIVRRAEPLETIDAIPVLHRSLGYRRFLRTSFQAPARLNLAGYMVPVQVLDVSLKGALVETSQALYCPLGTRGRLRLLLAPTTFIAMDVQVRRVQGSRLGLHCLYIDLDSITHLRQLLERNAQDPSLLGRDLALLVSGV
jgi:hypothetical protein